MNLLDVLNGDSSPATAMCSRKGCRNAATAQLVWNNPKVHTPERRKIWLGCDEHTAWLEDYLRSRSLWRETLPLASDGERR